MERTTDLDHRRVRSRSRLIAVLAMGGALAMAGTALSSGASSASVVAHGGGTATPATVWLCRPQLANDPCTSSLTTTSVSASGAVSLQRSSDASDSNFDCFYVYPTVSTEHATNADLKVQAAETDVAVTQASRFSQVCRVYAPVYRQVTLAGLLEYPSLDVPSSVGDVAYDSLLAGFEAFLSHDDDGRPIVFIGHSQGATILIRLLEQQVDNNSSLRSRLLLAIILGGDVEVRSGSTEGGSFSHIPACTRPGETGCVIAYSSFPSEPPESSLFGRPGQGVALQSGQTGKQNLQVVCTNPASLSGGSAELDPYFPSQGAVSTPWVRFPGLYRATCEQADGASWLEVKKATGSSDERPVVTEQAGPDWGYHADDVNLALGNLVADVAAAEQTWTSSHHAGA